MMLLKCCTQYASKFGKLISSIDRSEGAALLFTKPQTRSRSSMNGIAPGSPRTNVRCDTGEGVATFQV